MMMMKTRRTYQIPKVNNSNTHVYNPLTYQPYQNYEMHGLTIIQDIEIIF